MAEQAHIQNAKETLQAAFHQAVSEKKMAEDDYKAMKEEGLTNEDFDTWSAYNAPGYAAAYNNYNEAKSRYEIALQTFDREAFKAWQEKVKQAALNNIGPNGPNFNTLVGPDE